MEAPMVRKRLDLAQIVDKYGEKFEELVEARIQEGKIPPPLKRATIRRKRSSKTLIDSTHLLGSVNRKPWVQGNKLGCVVGVFDETAWYGIVHEFGYPADEESTTWNEDQVIPTRSFLRVPFDENWERLTKSMEDEVFQSLADTFLIKR
jgi:hypothetical protein